MKLLAMTVMATLMGFSTPSEMSVGTVAPDISLTNVDGAQVSLSSLRGSVVLIDFWASWCGPCRRKHPELVQIYEQFGGQKFAGAKPFEIFSVSLDRSKEAWVKAIAQDGLTWSNHVSDLKGWKSSVVEPYQIRSIPSNVLLDENGVIIAKNLHGEELAAAIAKLQ
jgi:thiol-disulfide isomerase/thioredoxin